MNSLIGGRLLVWGLGPFPKCGPGSLRCSRLHERILKSGHNYYVQSVTALRSRLPFFYFYSILFLLIVSDEN